MDTAPHQGLTQDPTTRPIREIPTFKGENLVLLKNGTSYSTTRPHRENFCPLFSGGGSLLVINNFGCASMARGMRAERLGTAFGEIVARHFDINNMKRTNKCPKCGSRDIITDAKAIDRLDNGALSVATFRKPGAVVFKGKLTTTLSAWVCADCGYLELYADNPKSIKVTTS